MKSTKTIRLRSLLLWGIIQYLLQAQLLMHKRQKLAVQLSINVHQPRLSGATITVKNTNRSHSCR